MSAESLVLTAVAVVVLIAAAIFCIRQFSRPISRPASPAAPEPPRPIFEVFSPPQPGQKTLADLMDDFMVNQEAKKRREAVENHLYGQLDLGRFGQKVPEAPPKA